MEVVVEYKYDALHDDELTLQPGDIIKNVRYIEEDGWMEGDLNGKRGLFPDNFVKEVQKEPKEAKDVKSESKEEASHATRREPKEEASHATRREKSAGNVANLVQRMSTIGIPTGGFQPHPPPTAKKPKKRQCKVLFEYQPVNDDELELKPGDILDITEEVEEGWWSGSLNGKSGLFPSNFVKELEASGEDGESTDTVADETNGNGMEGSGTPTSPQSAAGNGGTQVKKIRGVGFGDIFKEGSVKLKVRMPSPDVEDRKEKPIPSLPSAAKPTHPNILELQKGDGDSKAKAKEYCRVTFTFDATNDDELSLKEGDIIQILSKDTGEPGWWRGEIGGKEGVFPDNFVVMHTEAEKETPTSRVSQKWSPKQDSEEKPKKPPPPSKSIAPKPDFANTEKKTHPSRPEDRVDHRTTKPAAPLVPPKKPAPPPGKGRPGSLPPKRPDKPFTSSPNLKHNGEVPSTRPKSDSEPVPPTKPKTFSGDWGDKSSDLDLMSFDELSSTSEKLSHPTANRPKMPGRRLPAQFAGGQSPSKDVSIEKSFKADEEDGPKPKPAETKKTSSNPPSHSPSLRRPAPATAESKPSPVAAPVAAEVVSSDAKEQPDPEESAAQLNELRSQMKELLLSVELIKAQQMREMAELRAELDEEKLKRVALQVEIEKLKRSVHST